MLRYRTCLTHPGTACGLSEPVAGTTLPWPSHVKDISSATDGGHLHSQRRFVNSEKLLHILPLLHFTFKKKRGVTHFAFFCLLKKNVLFYNYSTCEITLTLARLWLTTQAVSLSQPPPTPAPGQSSSFLGSRCLSLTSSQGLRGCQPWNPYWASHDTIHQCFKGDWSLAVWERQSRLTLPKLPPSAWNSLWPGASEAWSSSVLFWPPEDNPPSPSNVSP